MTDCKLVLLTGAIAILGSGCVRSTHVQNPGPATDQLRVIAMVMRSEDVERIETLHIPLGQETFGDITPQVLQNGWHYKTTIRNLPSSSRDAVAEALTTASVRLDSRSVDLRQGVIFYSSKNDIPVGAIYFDRTGRRGVVNSTPVSFETGLLSRLRKILPLSLE
jgi:hypothetical protein